MKIIKLLTLLLLSNSLISQNWETNFTKAKEIASNDNKSIVLVFQGSDWCAPCIKLDREIWSTSKFKELSKNHFVMISADFPRKKINALSKEKQEANKNLAEKYNSYGYFPYVVVLNPKGEVLGEHGYEKTSPELYFKKLKNYEK
ncbi:MAG: thioredoxin family protein [Flavobacteriales bacterium]|mgnify:FL=1|jgi:thioredoxin-related protein|tara:strand:+ start:689 stop:1123 length:435 start_codon:yes stop_codon:yes gene_type:complete